MGLFTKKSEEQKKWENNQKQLLKELNKSLENLSKSKNYEEVKKYCLEASKYLYKYCRGRLKSGSAEVLQNEMSKKTYKGAALGRQLFKNENYNDDSVPTLLENLIVLGDTCGLFSGSSLSGWRLRKGGIVGLTIYYITYHGGKVQGVSGLNLKDLTYKIKNQNLSPAAKNKIITSLKKTLNKTKNKIAMGLYIANWLKS